MLREIIATILGFALAFGSLCTAFCLAVHLSDKYGWNTKLMVLAFLSLVIPVVVFAATMLYHLS